ncbi:MAG: HD domain-containing protein [Clostridia bacterium]|nr:HD domain-containing protein [Clostridia bacterium]
MKIDMPTQVKEIIAVLQQNGYRAYAVGGCIRDTIMGIPPSDWDICTSSLPQETLDALGAQNIVENGMKHGTVTVRRNGQNYEITTFRTDGVYLDNRHPQNVQFVRTLEQDLARRDFTVNAMAYNDTDGLCDCFGGTEDIQRKLIRCVGNPDQRFQEDGLRILRALRFSSQLGFEIESSTADSIRKNAHLLQNISAERILSELIKILTGKNVEYILLHYSGVLEVFLPEIRPMVGLEQNNPHHIYDVWTHTVKTVAAIPPERTLRLAALFHDFGKPDRHTVDSNGIGHFKGHPEVSAVMAEKILIRLKSDNQTKSDVAAIIRMHDARPPAEPKYVRRQMAKLGERRYPMLLELKKADSLAQNPRTIPQKLEYISRLNKIYQNEMKQGGAVTIKSLAVNGNDMINLGIKDGRMIGECLNTLCQLVIDGEVDNEKGALMIKIKELYGSTKTRNSNGI